MNMSKFMQGLVTQGVIVSLDGRWDWVGIVEDVGSDGSLVLGRPHNLRAWGTKSGIGQLSAGPTPATVCDPAGKFMVIPPDKIVFCIPTDRSKWPCLK